MRRVRRGTIRYTDLDYERIYRYVGRMTARAGWPPIEGGYLGQWVQQREWFLTASDGPVHALMTLGSSHRLSVVVPSRDLNAVPSLTARVSADLLRGVRRALS